MSKDNQKKRPPGRRGRLEDFQRVPSGEYIYTGTTYVFSGTPEQRRSGLIRLWIPAVILLAAVAVPGCIDPVWLPDHALIFLILVPYICMFFCAVSIVWALVRLSVNRDPIRAYVYSATVEALPRRTVFTASFAALSLVCALIALALGVFRTAGSALLMCGLYLAGAVCALGLRRLLRGMRWKDSRDPDLPQGD